jgi:hypothetical protein
MANLVENIRIEPCDVTWEIEEKWQVTTIADVALSLQNQWFKMYKPDLTWKHVWFNVATLGVDPAPPGSSGGIVVAIATNASAATVAAAVQVAVDADAAWIATVASNKVTITNIDVGQTGSMIDGTATTGFTFAQLQDGGSLEMGYLDGDIEVSFEEQQLDITAHQTGTTVLTGLRQGLINEVTMTMKEADLEKYKELLLGTAGSTYTPGGGTEVMGWGTASLGQNVFIKARRLVLHPVALDTSDKTRDICFWKAYALPESLVISGENPKTLGLKFKVYRDDVKPAGINQFILGDWSQSAFVP